MRTDLEGRRGLLFVSFDTADEDEEAEDEEQEELGGDVGLHEFDRLLDRGKVREVLSHCSDGIKFKSWLTVPGGFTRDNKTDQP